MFDKLKIDSNLSKEKKIEITLDYAQKVCNDVFKSRFNNLDFSSYKYSLNEAKNELGLDEEFIIQLVEDYISQIFKANDIFEDLILNLRKQNYNEKKIILIQLHELAHKNLGVVKNLHIKDAQILLNDLMTQHHDLNHLEDCARALQACAFKLNPEYGYDALCLMKLKKTL
ncbi:MAG: hypothetical protein L3I99_01815 [Sulfurimonas sp.]|nr:hypothetical protein [Sulfurimonas sp.]